MKLEEQEMEGIRPSTGLQIQVGLFSSKLEKIRKRIKTLTDFTGWKCEQLRVRASLKDSELRAVRPRWSFSVRGPLDLSQVIMLCDEMYPGTNEGKYGHQKDGNLIMKRSLKPLSKGGRVERIS